MQLHLTKFGNISSWAVFSFSVTGYFGWLHYSSCVLRRKLMSTIHSLIAACQFNRTRTLATLERAEQDKDSQRALAFRPGPGRAHVAWQLMHVAITEELFATERLW